MNDFHVVEGRLNASDYIGILEDKVVPFTVSSISVMGIYHFNKAMHLVIQHVQCGRREKDFNPSTGHLILPI